MSMRLPKVYGWSEDCGERLIYMEHVQGVTVDERWPSLSALERRAVMDQLASPVSSMRCLTSWIYIGTCVERHSGWTPEFWEYIKAFFTVDGNSDGDWKDHIAMFVLPAHEEELVAFDALNGTSYSWPWTWPSLRCFFVVPDFNSLVSF
ncbi:hypothetical protein FPV67DRAFT_1658215 [Lyophyllum atratum]|nr:hypothetical protein FPV67DRAFT_1658215 [Lyophyllum atratum]